MNEHLLGNSIDKSQIPPLHQKRILAFVNHFVINSCSFLNEFASKCETKFIEVERKMQKVEASLIIIESKLSSIPGLDEPPTTQKSQLDTNPSSNQTNPEPIEELDSSAEGQVESNEIENRPQAEEGIRACEDARYKKFFKMVQFGVPVDAVKMKMKAEGLDPSIINSPNVVLPDGVPCEP